jgi:hypothetical protein
VNSGTAQLLRKTQRDLERYYELEQAPDVTLFAAEAAPGERESVLVRERHGDVEIAVIVPAPGARERSGDAWVQVLEGVSHFVHLVERVRTNLPTTQLELELQAEVDKFVLLSLEHGPWERRRLRRVQRRLYHGVRFLHAANTEVGERYRLAHQLAARLSERLMSMPPSDVRAYLRRFYRAGQEGKIALAQAA